MKKRALRYFLSSVLAFLFLCMIGTQSFGVTIAEIKERGVLIHLGVPYANFVTGSGDGLDVDLMQMFARYLGVGYQYVKTSWQDVVPDLTGKKFAVEEGQVRAVGEAPVKGDIAANGMTVLPARSLMVDFSTPTFPTQVWLIAHADSAISPIALGGSIKDDLASVRTVLKDREVLGMANTCLEPDIYKLKEISGIKVKYFPGSLNELAPAVINGEAEMTLLDVPDALVALQKWPGKIKVIGPISETQLMGCAFDKSSGELREAFNRFFEQCKKDGSYEGLVMKYYPGVQNYFPEFFSDFGQKE